MNETHKGDIIVLLQETNDFDEIKQLLHEQLLAQNRDFVKLMGKSLSELEELKRFQGSSFNTISRRRLVEDQDTILQFTVKIQELQKSIA